MSEGKLGSRMDRFGIMAPYTAEITAFEENRRPYARTIVKRETLDLEDDPLF